MKHFVDMTARAAEDSGHGALWGTESDDLDCTLVAWQKGSGVPASTNDEVDVAMIVLEGEASIEFADHHEQLSAGQLLVIEKGVSRQIVALSDRLVYLNVHKRRRKMQVGSMENFRRPGTS